MKLSSTGCLILAVTWLLVSLLWFFWVKNTAIGILAGAFLSSAVVVVMFLLDDKSKTMIQSPDDLRALYPDIMVLAMIPDMRLSDKKNDYYSHYYESEPKKKEVKANGSGK